MNQSSRAHRPCTQSHFVCPTNPNAQGLQGSVKHCKRPIDLKLERLGGLESISGARKSSNWKACPVGIHLGTHKLLHCSYSNEVAVSTYQAIAHNKTQVALHPSCFKSQQTKSQSQHMNFAANHIPHKPECIQVAHSHTQILHQVAINQVAHSDPAHSRISYTPQTRMHKGFKGL